MKCTKFHGLVACECTWIFVGPLAEEKCCSIRSFQVFCVGLVGMFHCVTCALDRVRYTHRPDPSQKTYQGSNKMRAFGQFHDVSSCQTNFFHSLPVAKGLKWPGKILNKPVDRIKEFRFCVGFQIVQAFLCLPSDPGKVPKERLF